MVLKTLWKRLIGKRRYYHYKVVVDCQGITHCYHLGSYKDLRTATDKAVLLEFFSDYAVTSKAVTLVSLKLVEVTWN